MSAKIPVAVACSLIAFALGALAGVGAMSGFGWKWERQIEGTEGPPPLMPPGAGGGGGARGPGAGGGGGGRPGGGGGGGQFAISKFQLTGLVTTLDALTMEKPLKVELSAEQKKKALEHLRGLEEATELSDDEAKKRLEALLEVLKGSKQTMEEAGYRWPGQGAPAGPPRIPPNPFKEGDGNKHLKSLVATLSKS